MNEYPLVSVICISMNHAKYVKQSFESVIQQTYPNIEIIYVDNNSTDDTFEIANELFLKSGLPYKGFKREKNYNIPENFNFLLSHSTGKYIVPQSGDDWFELNNIEEKIKYYENNPQYGLLYCNGYLYYDDTQTSELINSSKYKTGNIFDTILVEGIYYPIGYVIRKDVFDVVGLYDETLIFDDWDMWLRILEHYPIGYFDIPLVYYRRHSTTFYFKMDYKKHRQDVLRVLDKYKNHPLYNKALEEANVYYIYGLVKKYKGKMVLKEILKVGKPNWFYFKQLGKLLLKEVGLMKQQK